MFAVPRDARGQISWGLSYGPCGCWELNVGPLEEQSAILTAEPSLQLLEVLSNFPSWTRGMFQGQHKRGGLSVAPQTHIKCWTQQRHL